MRIYELTTPAGDELAVHYADGAATLAITGELSRGTGRPWAQIELPDDELERLTAAILATLHGLHPRQQPTEPVRNMPADIPADLDGPAPHEAPDGARFAAAEAARELLPEYAETTEVLGVAHWLLTGEIPPITAEQLRPLSA